MEVGMPQVAGERVGVRGSTKEHLTYFFVTPHLPSSPLTKRGEGI
jgi:hypothetical protein